jgi:hypothetical protein
MLHLANPLEKGMKLDLFILLPFNGKKWMKYSAHVIRVEDSGPKLSGAKFGAAVEFEGARPEFATK